MITYDIKDAVVSVRPHVLFSGELPERPALTRFSSAQMNLTTQMCLSPSAIFNKRTTCVYSQSFVYKNNKTNTFAFPSHQGIEFS